MTISNADLLPEGMTMSGGLKDSLTFGLGAYTAKIVELKKSVGMGLIGIGGILSSVLHANLWKEQYDTFNAYLGSPEVSMSRPMAYKAMAVYEKFIEEHKIPLPQVAGIDPDKLYAICPVVDKENIGEWLGKARELSRSDLSAEVQAAKGKKPKEPEPLDSKIKQFIADMFPQDRRKEFIVEVLREWENWKKGA